MQKSVIKAVKLAKWPISQLWDSSQLLTFHEFYYFPVSLYFILVSYITTKRFVAFHLNKKQNLNSDKIKKVKHPSQAGF